MLHCVMTMINECNELTYREREEERGAERVGGGGEILKERVFQLSEFALQESRTFYILRRSIIMTGGSAA